MKNNSVSNRHRLFNLLIPGLFLVALLLTWGGYRGLTQITMENGQNFIFQSVQFFGKTLELSIENKKEDVNNLIFDESLVDNVYFDDESTGYKSHLEHLFEGSNNAVTTIIFLDTSDQIVKAYEYNQHQVDLVKELSGLNEYLGKLQLAGRNPEENETSTGKAYYIGQDSYLNIYQKVISTEGKYLGTIVVPIKLQVFFENFLQDFELSYKGYPVIKNRKMDYLMHPSTERVGQSVVELRKQDSPDADVSDLKRLEAQQLSQESGEIEFYSYRKTDDNRVNKRRRIGAFQWITIGADSWLVMIDADYQEVTRDIAEMGFVIATLFVMVILGCIIAMVAVKKIRDKETIENDNHYLRELQARKDELFVKEKKLYEMSKMETIGIVTTTIVHDMNNFLTPIIANAELISEGYSTEDEQYDDLQEILKAARIGKEMSKNILRFSRNSWDIERQQQYDISQIIKDAVGQVMSIIPDSIEFQVLIDEQIGQIQVELVDIQNLVYNLLKNAYQAVSSEKGMVEISLKKADKKLLEAFREESPYGRNETHGVVVFEIADNGSGMAPEVQKHIYEPFFSTKKEEEGTGLGMFVVSSIVKKYDWKITLSTELHKGTTIQILIPYHLPL